MKIRQYFDRSSPKLLPTILPLKIPAQLIYLYFFIQILNTSKLNQYSGWTLWIVMAGLFHCTYRMLTPIYIGHVHWPLTSDVTVLDDWS